MLLFFNILISNGPIVLTETTAALNEVALSCHRVHELYFLAVVFAEAIFMYTTM